MYHINYTNQFKKDYKIIKKRGYDIYYKENINGFKECHIQPDWLLIYYYENDKVTITASRTGSHSDLFL